MTQWVWAPEPFDMWFGPYDDAAPERDRLQEYYGDAISLQVVEDSKLVQRRVILAAQRQEED